MEVTTREHTYLLDEPKLLGGDDAAVSPVELAVGALAGCAGITLKALARYLVKVDVSDVAVRVEVAVNPIGTDVDVPFDRATIHYELTTDADAEQRAQLEETVPRLCPVGKLYRAAGVGVNEEWTFHPVGDGGGL